MRNLIKKIVSKVSVDTYQRFLAYSIFKNHFNSLNSSQTFNQRETLWDTVINLHTNINNKIIYVEFGVHKGYSLNYFSKNNNNLDSIFIGLDSFEGLPESWGKMPKGTFDTNGKIPNTNDKRVIFIKGWFQNS